VKINPATRFLLTSAAVAMSWPLAIAHAGLRLAYVRPYIASEASIIALPISVALAIVAAAILSRWPPKEAVSWFITCTMLGAVLSDVWLALGEYVSAGRDIVAFGRTLIGGAIFAVPIGLVVGMILGLEIVALRLWDRRSQAWHCWWPVPVVAIAANIVVAGLISYGTESMRTAKTHNGFAQSGMK